MTTVAKAVSAKPGSKPVSKPNSKPDSKSGATGFASIPNPPKYDWTPALKAEMAPMYERVRHVITPMEWPHYAPLIKAINELKTQRNAVILAHNYMTPEIFHCVADFRGDSLQLAKEASRTDAESSSRRACTSWPRPRSCSPRTRPC